MEIKASIGHNGPFKLARFLQEKKLAIDAYFLL
jgi:hypothetical protein